MNKNRILILIGIAIIIIIVLFMDIRKKKDSNVLETVKLAEVTHSMFYAPLYVAIEEGYFEEEGIDLNLILTSGADKVSAAVLSGDVHVGFAGPESAIYVYENGEDDYLVTFAGLTKRDGQFIVSRNRNDKFKVSDLYDKEILVGRKGGMPALNFRNGMKLSNADISKIDINESVDFASLTGVFLSGVGDYVNLFDLKVIKKMCFHIFYSSNSKSFLRIFFILNSNPNKISATEI